MKIIFKDNERRGDSNLSGEFNILNTYDIFEILPRIIGVKDFLYEVAKDVNDNKIFKNLKEFEDKYNIDTSYINIYIQKCLENGKLLIDELPEIEKFEEDYLIALEITFSSNYIRNGGRFILDYLGIPSPNVQEMYMTSEDKSLYYISECLYRYYMTHEKTIIEYSPISNSNKNLIGQIYSESFHRYKNTHLGNPIFKPFKLSDLYKK